MLQDSENSFALLSATLLLETSVTSTPEFSPSPCFPISMTISLPCSCLVWKPVKSFWQYARALAQVWLQWLVPCHRQQLFHAPVPPEILAEQHRGQRGLQASSTPAWCNNSHTVPTLIQVPPTTCYKTCRCANFLHVFSGRNQQIAKPKLYTHHVRPRS